MLLSLRGVGKVFAARNVSALRDIDLVIEEGEFLALLGPSGCGKSTLLRLIAGLENSDSGVLNWANPLSPGQIGFVFQDANLLPWATVLENAALPGRIRGDNAMMAHAREILIAVGLGDFLQAYPRELSGGMRMRVSIARALAARPRLLLMDEPFAALDEFTRHRLQDDLLQITARENCTTVFVTHSLYEAAFLANRVAVMQANPGRIASILDLPDPRPRARFGAAYNENLAALQVAVNA